MSYEIEALKDKGVSKFLESEIGKKRIKEILEYPNEKTPKLEKFKGKFYYKHYVIQEQEEKPHEPTFVMKEDFKNFREYYGEILNLLCFEIPMRIIIALIDNMKEECELK